jgi:hypothetical protein
MWGSPRHLIPTFLGIGLAAAVPVGGCGDGAGGTRIASLPTGGEPVQLDPEVFSTRIDNPYWPMQPGERRVYRVTDSEGLKQRDVVTGQTRHEADSQRGGT